VLCEACERFGWRLHAYVIMRNHFHLALETPEPNLSVGMKWLQGTWSRGITVFALHRPSVPGPVQVSARPARLLRPCQVAHYIHFNPVRARILPAEQVDPVSLEQPAPFPAAAPAPGSLRPKPF